MFYSYAKATLPRRPEGRLLSWLVYAEAFRPTAPSSYGVFSLVSTSSRPTTRLILLTIAYAAGRATGQEGLRNPLSKKESGSLTPCVWFFCGWLLCHTRQRCVQMMCARYAGAENKIVMKIDGLDWMQM